jgi:hypothetical protein
MSDNLFSDEDLDRFERQTQRSDKNRGIINEMHEYYPNGDKIKAYSEFLNVAEREGDDITIEFIAEKWKQYIDSVKSKNTDPMYIKSLQNFIRDGKYNETFTISKKKEEKKTLHPFNVISAHEEKRY